MDAFQILKNLTEKSDTSMRQVALKMGITPQSLYGSLKSRVSLDVFSRAVEAAGWKVVLCRIDENGRPVDMGTLKHYSEKIKGDIK